MYDVARIYLFVFGVLTIAGGALGYAKAKSKASIVAGATFGGVLLLAGYLAGAGAIGMYVGLVASGMLAARFSNAYRTSKKVMPAGLMAALGVGGVILTLLAVFI